MEILKREIIRNGGQVLTQLWKTKKMFHNGKKKYLDVFTEKHTYSSV